MSDVLKAIILGIVEGLTEFLPISSTGHLIIVNKFVDFNGSFSNMFDIVIQFGAILAIVVYFWRKLLPFRKDISIDEKNEIWDIWKKTIVAVLPALIIGVYLADPIEKYLFNPSVVSIALVVGGIILLFVEGIKKPIKFESISSLTYKTALFIGLIQCLAMIPGTSRSAATIIGAILLGASRVVAAEFSFYLAIPTLFAASSYKLLKAASDITGNEILILLIGTLVSFVVALVVVASFMKYITKKDFKPFGYYRIILGIILLMFFK